jgi:hypothetical protein
MKILSSLKTRIYPKWFPNASAVTWSRVLQTRKLANKTEEFWTCDDFRGEISQLTEKCIRSFPRCYVNRENVTPSWRVLVTPLAAPSIIKRVHHCRGFYQAAPDNTISELDASLLTCNTLHHRHHRHLTDKSQVAKVHAHPGSSTFSLVFKNMYSMCGDISVLKFRWSA